MKQKFKFYEKIGPTLNKSFKKKPKKIDGFGQTISPIFDWVVWSKILTYHPYFLTCNFES